MRIQQPPIQQLLNRSKSTNRKLHILRHTRPSRIRTLAVLLTKQHPHIEPRGLNSAGAGPGDGFAEGLEGDVASASAPDGGVAELGGLGLGDTVEGEVEASAGVGGDFLGAGGAVVVKDLFGAEAGDEIVVGGGAGGDGAEADSVAGG